eukprot:7312673-Alexandrium_andersonii.AAC.1
MPTEGRAGSHVRIVCAMVFKDGARHAGTHVRTTSVRGCLQTEGDTRTHVRTSRVPWVARAAWGF